MIVVYESGQEGMLTMKQSCEKYAGLMCIIKKKRKSWTAN